MTGAFPFDPPHGANWTDAVALLRQACVLCIGDIMLDRFVSGAVDRISPEAPVPVLRAGMSANVAGGVGNVGRNIAALGARAIVCASIGSDDDGRSLAAILDAQPSIDARLVVDPTQPTTMKARYLSAGNHMLRVDVDPTGALDGETMTALDASFAEGLDRAGAVILSDYGKGVLAPGALAGLIAQARSRLLPIIVDPKGADYERYRGASVLTPNRKELSEAVGRTVDGDIAIVAAAESLIARFDIGAILVTRSEEGMTLVRRGMQPRYFKTEAAEVFDVAGAGDTVVAVLATGLACNLPIETAVVLANLAASIVVRKIGTAVASHQELRALVGPRLDGHVGKLMMLDDCLEQANIWRSEGRRIGFTNGCFDVLHAGHIELLRKSRAEVDRLVLGLNSDRSVRGLKGPKRPINAQEARARVLSAIEYVDAIIIFDESTPEAVIRELRPDVLMKGSDYTVGSVVGADFVQGYGGDVRLIDLMQGYSTTSIVAKLSGT